MPALPPVASTLRVAINWNLFTEATATTTLYFKYTGSAPDSSDASNLAAAAINAFATASALWNADIVLAGARVTDLTSNTSAEGTAVGDHAGSKSGLLSGGTCLVMGYTINRRYRGGKPRSYLPWGAPGDLLGPSAWDSDFLAAAATAAATVFSTFIGTTEGSTTVSDHVNVSYYEGSRVVTSPTTGRARNVPILRANPVVDTITGRTFLGSPGSQRRRNR